MKKGMDSEEGTYETATSQENIESQTTEQSSDAEDETEVLVGIKAAMQVPDVQKFK